MAGTNEKTTSMTLPNDADIAAICGAKNCNLEKIEQEIKANITITGRNITISGNHSARRRTTTVINGLVAASNNGGVIDEDLIKTLLTRTPANNNANGASHAFDKAAAHAKPITAKNEEQAQYMEALQNDDVIFAIGPAGTGKTLLAISAAVDALIAGKIKKIMLCRPAVETEEKVGFLPGDINAKLAPYMIPLYDALEELLGVTSLNKMMEQKKIEIIPFMNMRGRTLKEAFIILDEGQNTTDNQFEMFMTRIGSDTKVVVAGDIEQCDLPKNTPSGLKTALAVFKDVPGFSVHHLTKTVRSPTADKAVQAYARYKKNINPPAPKTESCTPSQ